MSEKRMFSKTIVLSDAFLDMPMSARCLYFTLSMFGDDDGFVNSPKAIMRQCGASDDDLRVLFGKKFILPFESGVIVIKHWRINNYLRADRYQPTKYLEEKEMLKVDDNGAYTMRTAEEIETAKKEKSVKKLTEKKDRVLKIRTPKVCPICKTKLEDSSGGCKTSWYCMKCSDELTYHNGKWDFWDSKKEKKS